MVSPEATIEVAEGLIELHTNEAFPTEAIVDGTLTPEQETAIDNITLTSINTSLMISLSVHQEGENLSQFSGQMAFEVIRSTNDYIAFAGLKDINLEGRFSLGDDYVSAKVSAVQNNAEIYAPLTQEHEVGEVSTELLSYDYNGTDAFTLHTPDYSYTDTADGNYAYEVLFVDYETNSQNYKVYLDNFEDYVTSQVFTIDSEYGSYVLEGGNLLTGTADGSALAAKNNSNESAPETFNVSYTYNEGHLTYTYPSYYSESLTGKSYSLISTEEDGINIESTNIWAYPYYGTSSPETFISDRTLYVQVKVDNQYSGYLVDGKELTLGTNQEIAGTLYYSTNGDMPESLSFQYDFNNEYLEFSNEIGESHKLLFVKSEEYIGLNVARKITSSFISGFGSNDEAPYLSYGSTKGTFQEYLERYTVSNEEQRLDSIGELTITPFDLTVGTDLPLTTTISRVYSLENYENEGNFANLSVSAEFEVQLETLGNTKVSTQIERTGFDDGVAILTIENTDSTSLNSEITLMATVNDNQLGSLSIANGDGFVISKDALVDSGEAIELTYGLETAKVESVSTGIKVTYSNGEFDLY